MARINFFLQDPKSKKWEQHWSVSWNAVPPVGSFIRIGRGNEVSKLETRVIRDHWHVGIEPGDCVVDLYCKREKSDG